MAKKILKINTVLPAIPGWLKINNSVTFSLPLKNAKELAKKLSEIDSDIDVELNLATGEKLNIEIKYE
jgi:hypothetical protein